MRQIVLDTETTGLEVSEGHRIIEIGCIELVDRRPSGRTFHEYMNPDREVEPGALEIHNISNEFLAHKPHFPEISESFLKFVSGAELVIHNATFDLGFINNELRKAGSTADITQLCGVLDTLELARRLHPGQKNSLEALCKRYNVDDSAREYHGALLDAQILADVYLAMTGGQAALMLDASAEIPGRMRKRQRKQINRDGLELRVIRATEQECEAHRLKLEAIAKSNGGTCLWQED